MKKIYLILLMAVTALTATAQTIGEAFYIYRNDGGFNAFFRDEVQSIEYSHYDLDSIFYDEIVTQLVYTQDSLYRIPLAVIDSVGFVTPATEYKQDAIQLTDDLFDHVISVDSMDIVFAANTPAELLPKVGDKIATVELTEKFPTGFSGKVLEITTSDDGFHISCERINLSEAVSRFYGVVELVSQREGQVRRYLKKTQYIKEKTFDLTDKLPEINVPIEVNITPVANWPFTINNQVSLHLKPSVTGKVVCVVDDNLFVNAVVNHYKIHAVTNMDADIGIDVGGSVHTGDDLKWPMFGSGDYYLPWCPLPVYIEYGLKLEFAGELLVGTTVHANFSNITDITYYPITTPLMFSTDANLFNSIDTKIICNKFSMDWARVSFSGGASLEAYFKLGLSTFHHVLGWAGIEAAIGAKLECNAMLDFEQMKTASKSTKFYEDLKESCSVNFEPYWTAKGVVAGFNDNLEFKIGKPHSFNDTKWFQGSLIPLFRNTTLTNTQGRSNSLDATVMITNNCPMPYTVGFAIYDDEGNQVGQTYYNAEKFRLLTDMQSYSTTFANLEFDKLYKVYPVLQLYGNDVLATPYAELKTKPFPVTLSDFKVTKSQYKKGGFHNDGIDHDYCFNVSVTATLVEGEDVVDWGYVYRDPNGREKEISLMAHGNYYVDNDYAYYRNSPISSVCLYPYVKYADSNERLQLQPVENDVEYVDDGSVLFCPDNNHPHAIDLGLPSGTKWACCNVGASTPEGYGNYYAWGETQPKAVYYMDTYLYGYIDFEDKCYRLVNIGSDIASTDYDAATANWGMPWHMPSLVLIQELLDNTTSVWTTQNGVNGRMFTGPSSENIFLPAAGLCWVSEFISAGSTGNYRSSTIIEGSSDSAYGLLLFSSYPGWCDYDRFAGLTVRPVR